MLFNSPEYAVFFLVVFILYWFVFSKKLLLQNALLLGVSYYFYACWDWRFLFLLMFSTVLDYMTGVKMEQTSSVATKRIWFWISVFINLGFLGVFKYYNFFVESFTQLFNQLGWSINPVLINVVLPVGISFYTFHGLSYVIDIYKGRIQAERNFISYAVFVSFFPLLVAGPIERATHLLPQIKRPRKFDYGKSVDGLRQILWGLFKKIVIADNSARLADMVFNNYVEYSGAALLLGAVFFAFQIYGDFSGYSDIALGSARLLGIELLQNFSYPYFSRDIAEFWRRWHISLSSWFKDYLYIPLGGSEGGKWMRIRNTFIIFTVSGFWHGANWTFIFWGMLNALFILPSIISKTNRSNLQIVAAGRMFPTLQEVFQMMATFGLAVFAWIFFRSQTLIQSIGYVKNMFVGLVNAKGYAQVVNILYWRSGYVVVLFIVFMICVEWIGREQKHGLARFAFNVHKPLRWLVYVIIAVMILLYSGTDQQFIYFQF